MTITYIHNNVQYNDFNAYNAAKQADEAKQAAFHARFGNPGFDRDPAAVRKAVETIRAGNPKPMSVTINAGPQPDSYAHYQKQFGMPGESAEAFRARYDDAMDRVQVRDYSGHRSV